MDKKSTSAATSLTADSSDSYWLACIAHNNQNATTPKTESATVGSKRSNNPPAIPETPATKNYPRSPADSFWLKQTDLHHQGPVAGDVVVEDVLMPQGDARVSIPAHISYKAIIDDGKTHHLVWSIRNMSPSGALLDMNVTHLREGLAVDLLLRYTHKGTTMARRLPAKVVRTQLHGVALQFSHYGSATCHDLVELLYSA